MVDVGNSISRPRNFTDNNIKYIRNKLREECKKSKYISVIKNLFRGTSKSIKTQTTDKKVTRKPFN